MEYNCNHGKSASGSWATYSIIALFFTALIACTGGSYGKLVPSQEADTAFESGNLPSEYTYYYYGRETKPYAIAGIHNQYQLESKAWKQVGTSPQSSGISYPYKRLGLYPSGKKIVGPAGEDLGIWYSIWPRTKVVMAGGNRIVLHPPDINGGSGIRADDQLN